VASEWEDFKNEYGKFYNGDEEEKRHGIFESNLDFIATENAKENSFTLGVGPFADITTEEFTETYLGYTKPDDDDVPVLDTHEWGGEELPTSLDWTTKGAVTPVKSQGHCGSCWSFSTTGALEGGYQILGGGPLVSLSEQQYVDCAPFPNMGCNGGNMNFGLRFAKDHDICTESSYPYKAVGGKCHSSGCTVGLASGTVTGVKALGNKLFKAKDQDIMSAVAVQPLSVAIEADKKEFFQHYKSGVLTGAGCGTSTDHGVLLVGYGHDTASGTDFWKLKNSWTAQWGDSGYVRVARGQNMCGINTGVNYPTFASPSVSV